MVKISCEFGISFSVRVALHYPADMMQNQCKVNEDGVEVSIFSGLRTIIVKVEYMLIQTINLVIFQISKLPLPVNSSVGHNFES